ncbi:MAG TPA: S8 family serine peptidase [Candidatus Limnocylindria bacterium]
MGGQRMHARVLVFVCVISLMALLTGPAVAAASSTGKLSKADRERLAAATANGAATVTMLFATVETSTSSVAAALTALGATVRKTDADVGYIRADVPTAKADQAAKLPGVVGSELDQVFTVEPPDTGEGSGAASTPSDTTPAENPYMPTRDTGAPQFVAAHPTWDGRGVTIGILDLGVDLGHPALQTTTTGERKVIDWLTYTDPVTDGDPSWVKMDQTVTITGGTFTVGTRTYTGAPNGTWKYGEFSEDNPAFANLGGSATAEYRIACANRTGGGGDLDRDGNCGNVYAILWDGKANGTTIRDSDHDLSFADEIPMTNDYKTSFQVGEYGHDNPATAIRESVPFVNQVDTSGDGYVSLGIVSGAHATHVAGIAAGGALFGDATGAAPGAKIVSVRVCLFTSGCTAHALTEGMIYAAKDAHVDVISMSIGGLPSLNDGNNARAILYNRLIDKWGAQIFLSAGNSGPGVNTIGDPAVATKAMAIGAYWRNESVLANYGNAVPSYEALHDFSSRGPREDGGLKPEVVAPGNATSSVPTWQTQQCVAPIVCAPGLGMFNGTSMAAPQASGAAALLLSAAIQSAVGHKPAQLRMAIDSSARFIANYQAHEQGFGLIDVGAAWDLLKTNLKTQDIDSSVAVNSKLSGFLATPGKGRGIYEREGWHPGDPAFTRTYTFTRSDGGIATYNLRWVGNDGSFELSHGQTTLTIGNKGSATLDVTVHPGSSSGVSSALLLLDDPKTPGIEYATLNTIITSIPLTAGNGYKATVAGTASRFEASQPKVFFDVPLGTTAMRLTLNVTNQSRVNATPIHPYGVPLTGIGLTTGPTNTSANAPRTLVIATGPTDGVWEVATSASRANFTAWPAPAPQPGQPGAPAPDYPLTSPATFEITYEAFKDTIEPSPLVIGPYTLNTPVTGTFTAHNAFAAVSTVNTVGATLSSVRSLNDLIANGAARNSYDITVPAGLTSLNVSIGNAADPGADLDLYLYNCTTGTCVPAGAGTTSTANESVTVSSPAAGLWRAEVDPFSVPAGTTSYTYSDAFTRSSGSPYGTLTTTANSSTARASGATWTFDVTATALQPAGEGRFLRGSAQVRLGSATGAILGSATVELRNP